MEKCLLNFSKKNLNLIIDKTYIWHSIWNKQIIVPPRLDWIKLLVAQHVSQFLHEINLFYGQLHPMRIVWTFGSKLPHVISRVSKHLQKFPTSCFPLGKYMSSIRKWLHKHISCHSSNVIYESNIYL